MATEGVQIVRRQWWFGCVFGAVCMLVLLPGFGPAAALSFGAGLLAVMLGSLAAGWFTFRRRAPSGAEAAVALMGAMALRWGVVLVALLVAFALPAARPLWVLLGLLVAQGAAVLAALTFKR